VYERRREKGITQGALAKALGVTFQAVQKYETAESRISASTLYRLCQVLDVTPSYFFAGYPEPSPPKAQSKAGSGQPVTRLNDELTSSGALRS
jgi:transcriptional regulator with XRE-family HTH domain